MSRKGRGRLSEEDRQLWERVTRRATPMHPPRPAPAESVAQQIARPRPAAPAPAPLAPFRIGEKHTDTALPAQANPSPPVRMDAREHARLKRGKMQPEARIDLHGMTMAEAHPALTGFLFAAQAGGKRLVLVITGKGKDRDDPGPIPVRRGILRHQVPHWLETPPLSGIVLHHGPAHVRHGGKGALYVYLRRQR